MGLSDALVEPTYFDLNGVQLRNDRLTGKARVAWQPRTLAASHCLVRLPATADMHYRAAPPSPTSTNGAQKWDAIRILFRYRSEPEGENRAEEILIDHNVSNLCCSLRELPCNDDSDGRRTGSACRTNRI